MLKLKHHVEGARLWVCDFLCLRNRGTRRFTHRDAIVVIQHFTAHLAHEAHEARTMGHHFKSRLQKAFLNFGSVWQAGLCRVGCCLPRFGDHVDHIHAKTADAFFQPEVHQVIHLLAHFGVLPIQVGLLLRKHVQVVLTCCFVEGPSRAIERRFPVGGFASFNGIAPNVVVVIGVVA